MSELIDRLDAEQGWVNDGEMDFHDFADAVGAAYPELRALVLRLQEERDHALRANHMYRLEMGQAYDDMKSENDALLEALKRIDERACNSLGEDDQPDYGDLLTHMQGIRAETFATFANVEGTDG